MRRWTPAAMLAALALAGCGSSSLSDSQLRSQAARLCRLAAGQTGQVAAPASPAASLTFLKQGIAVLRPELRALRTLRPSGAARHDYAMAVSAFSAKLAALNDTVRDLSGGEDPVIAVKMLQRELVPVEARENASWQTLGVSACANS